MQTLGNDGPTRRKELEYPNGENTHVVICYSSKSNLNQYLSLPDPWHLQLPMEKRVGVPLAP